MNAEDGQKPLILLVDDQPANLHVLAASLKTHYRIKTATSGRAALQLARLDEDRPQLLLLDVMMPGLSGLEVLRELRANVETRDIAVIVVTADTSEASQLEGLELGADDFLTKPVVPALLLARVRNLLRRKQAEARFRQVVELSPCALLIVDADGRIRFANVVAATLFGHPADALRGEPIDRLIPEAERAQHGRKVADYLADPARRPMIGARKVYGRRADGSRFPCDVGLASFAAEEGVNVLVSVTDLSERVLAEERLREANDALERRVAARTAELEARNAELVEAVQHLSAARHQMAHAEKLASLGRMVASFAHDIGNPISNVATVMSSVAQRVRQLRGAVAAGTLRRSDLEDFFTTLETSTALSDRNLERASELLASFKQLALDEATSQRRVIDLLEWLGPFTYTLSPALAEGSHHIVLDVPTGLSVETSPGLLGQVIANLVANAVTHGFDQRRDGLIRISAARAADGAVELKVADDGAGIAAADLPRVFEPFFTTRAGAGGTGLGLDIVRGIVETSLGGRIVIDSVPGAGTSFTIRLPGSAPG